MDGRRVRTGYTGKRPSAVRWIVGALLAAALAGGTWYAMARRAPAVPADTDTAPAEDAQTPDTPPVPDVPEGPGAEEPVPEGTAWAPVAETAPVEDDYFDDVAFVGDSRTDGFRLYSGLDRGQYFFVTGETVASAIDQQNWKTESGEKISLADAVAAADCGKIYLMLGLNELGWVGTDLFRTHADALLKRLRADHPDAELVVQSLPPVTAEQDAKGSYVNNQRIAVYNEIWRELAEENGWQFVDVAAALTGEDGCLPKELSSDGVHMSRQGCRVWLHYLRIHAVGEAAQRPFPDGDHAP